MAKPKQNRNRPPGPDHDLAPEQFPEMNRQFYAAKLQPHDYLGQRYRSIFLAAQRPESLPDAFDQQLSIGDLRASWSAPEDWDDVEIRDYVSTESTVLLHHASETLFRLYFAHADSPECPWLGVARLRQPAQFKDRLDRFIKESESETCADSAMFVFAGTAPRPETDGERWDDVRGGLMLLLGYLGRRLLSEAPLYNSAKHGLSGVPGAAAMSYGDQAGPLAINANGPSITYLTVKDGQKSKRWFQETIWLDAARNLAVTGLAIQQVSNLWQCARARYTQSSWDASQMKYLTKNVANQVQYPQRDSEVTVSSMSMELLYYVDHDPRARHGSPTR